MSKNDLESELNQQKIKRLSKITIKANVFIFSIFLVPSIYLSSELYKIVNLLSIDINLVSDISKLYIISLLTVSTYPIIAIFTIFFAWALHFKFKKYNLSLYFCILPYLNLLLFFIYLWPKLSRGKF